MYKRQSEVIFNISFLPIIVPNFINCFRNVTACKCQDLNDCYKIDGLDKKFVVKGVKSMVSVGFILFRVNVYKTLGQFVWLFSSTT